MGFRVAMEVPVVASTQGAPVVALHFGEKLVQLASVGTATYQLEGSNDRATWVSEGAALTAAGNIAVTKKWAYLRWNCTAYTNGTPTSWLTGGSEK